LKAPARAILENKAAWLRANGRYKVRIEGHCDERGTNEYNLALGERRANSAFKYLNALGVSADRMSTISYGEERPADPGHNEAAWAKNRRDEFKLYK
jgi:peptidoglycan-associated lipoprotein